MLCAVVAAQEAVIPSVSDLRERRQTIGPLQMTEIENTLVKGKWSEISSIHARRISGKVPSESDKTPTQVSFSLSHITPRYSKSEEERKEYLEIFSSGLRELLKGREFYAETAHANYGPPGTFIIIAILSYDSHRRGELQKDMVKNGFAVVTSRHSTNLIERFGDDFRDNLLRLEGQAQLNKLGIWKE